jgi:hypothetical protein
MVDNPLWEICERVAELQALLRDHIECGKHSVRGRGGEGARDTFGVRADRGDVRCRLLPAEHAENNL